MDNPTTSNSQDLNFEDVFSWDIHLIPAKDKNEEWALDIFKAYFQFMQPLYNVDCYTSRPYNMGTIREYATGTQPSLIYKTMFDPQFKEGAYMGINFSNIPAIIPRFRQKLIADLLKAPVEIKALAVDPIANNKRGKDRERLKIQKALDEKLSEYSRIVGFKKPVKSGISNGLLKTSMPQMQTTEPQQAMGNMQFDLDDDYELQILMDKNSGFYNQDVELAQEIAIESIFKLNEIDNVNQLLIEDAIDYGRAAARVYVSKFTGMPIVDYMNLNYVNVPPTWKKDNKRSEFWCMAPMVPLSELLRNIGDSLTKEDVRQIYNLAIKTSSFANRDGNQYQTWNSGQASQLTYWDFDNIKVQLCYMEFRSPNMDVYESYTDKYGQDKMRKKSYDYEAPENSGYDKKRKETWYDCIYKGYYINGIDRVFDFGELNNMVREKGSEQYTPFTLLYWRFDDRSLTERMIPHTDNIIVAWLKLQYMLLKAKPAGVLWNVSMMQDIVLGDGGKISATEVAKLYEQTGNGYYNSFNEEGINMLPNGQPPVTELKNGLDPNIMLFWGTIRNEMQMISESIGLNEFTDAGTPNADSLVRVQNQAVSNSQDARYYLQFGMRRLISNVAMRTSMLIQQIIKYNPSARKQLEGMIGAVNIDIIETLDEAALSQFSIYLEETLGEKEKNEIKGMLIQAYAQGKIDLSDVLVLYQIKNWKLLSRLLSIKYQKRAIEQQKAQMAGMQMQQQQIQQSNQLELMLKKMDGDNLARGNEINGKFGVIEQQVKQHGDMLKKAMSEQVKTQIKDLDREHDKEYLQQEHYNVLSEIEHQKNADIEYEESKPKPKAASR